MGDFFRIAGWIECDDDDKLMIVENIKKLVSSSDDGVKRLYRQGWCWPEKDMNFISFVCYVGHVKSKGVDMFIEDLECVMKGATDVSGFFHVQDGDGIENLTIKIVGNNVSVTESDKLIEHKEFDETA